MIWKEKYRIGVPAIDAQHEELFSRVTVFMESLRSNVPWPEKMPLVNETLAFMKEYVITHFADEEAYQISVGYPGCMEHKKVHDDMVAYVAQTANEYVQAGCPEALMQQFAGKLLAWLINHVAAEDQRIASYAQEKEVTHHDG
ncbi:MAG: hemerythrin family protein [Eubacteriales bacterium]